MAKNNKEERLSDVTKRLLLQGTPDNEIVKSLQEIGLSEEKSMELLRDVKDSNLAAQEKLEAKVPQKTVVAQEKKGFFARVFGRGQKTVSKNPVSGQGVPDKKPVQPEAGKKPEQKKIGQKIVVLNKPFEQKRFAFREVLPVRVSDFDKLIERGGLKRGDTILLSGGCGTGKTTFGMQSLYNGALNGEKGVYFTLEETAGKMKENMIQNFGWKLEEMEAENRLAIIKIDPITIARAVEARITKERGGLFIDMGDAELPFRFNLPFKPDRVVFDSVSALSIAFMENESGFRQYLRHLFETLEGYNSVNLVLGETEQEPGIYSRSGIEEFLADGVIVLYNMKIHSFRQRALEILKLRSSSHVRKITPYNIGPNGMEVYVNQELFSES